MLHGIVYYKCGSDPMLHVFKLTASHHPVDIFHAAEEWTSKRGESHITARICCFTG